jgi:hypothetical protein
MLAGRDEVGYGSGEEDTKVCGEFHEFDVLFTHAVLEHVSFVEYADIEIEFLEPRTIFFRTSREFIPSVSIANTIWEDTW